jgi:nanoRNase/pAp phosphatase (c-di-AMP/oligoRNAs hydrolase)
MWNFSLYNDNGKVDCSVIAKSFGGGGNNGAAGFRIKDLSKIF